MRLLAALMVAVEFTLLFTWWPAYYLNGPWICRWRSRYPADEALAAVSERIASRDERRIVRPIALRPVDGKTVIFRESMALRYLFIYPLVLRGSATVRDGLLEVKARPCLWPVVAVGLTMTAEDGHVRGVGTALISAGVVAALLVTVGLLDVFRFRRIVTSMRNAAHGRD